MANKISVNHLILSDYSSVTCKNSSIRLLSPYTNAETCPISSINVKTANVAIQTDDIDQKKSKLLNQDTGKTYCN